MALLDPLIVAVGVASRRTWDCSAITISRWPPYHTALIRRVENYSPNCRGCQVQISTFGHEHDRDRAYSASRKANGKSTIRFGSDPRSLHDRFGIGHMTLNWNVAAPIAYVRRFTHW